MAVTSSTEGNNDNQRLTCIKEKDTGKTAAIHPTADKPIQEAREEVAMANLAAFKDETKPHRK